MDAAAANVGRLLRHARERDMPVALKHHINAFRDTPLLSMLQGERVDEVLMMR